MINKKLVLELIPKYHENGSIQWSELVKEYNYTTKENRTRNTLRSIWTRLPNHEKDKIRGKQEKQYKETFQKNADGSYLYDRLIQMHEGDMIDDTKVLESFNLDPLKWVITSSTFNLWSVESKDKRLNNYQAKIKVKPKEVKDINSIDLLSIINSVKPLEKIKTNKVDSDNSYAIRITDTHIGSNVFNEYAMYTTIEKAKKDILNNDISKVYIDFLGDILHVDNNSKTTDRGTQLEMEMSSYDMIRKAVEVIAHVIRELSIVETQVNWVQGNHSRTLEFVFFLLVENMFVNNEHIKFNVDETTRKAYMIYDTMINLFHGDIPKKNYYQIFQFEFSDLWGQAKRWELHSGHFHSLSQTTIGGMLHTIHGVQKFTDDYERSLAYTNKWLKLEAVLYNKDLGRVETFLY